MKIANKDIALSQLKQTETLCSKEGQCIVACPDHNLKATLELKS